MKAADSHPNQHVCVLIATPSPTDQHLIAQRLQTCWSKVELLYSATVDETLICLSTTAMEYYNFPSLLLLDLDMAPRPLAWSLLEQIRASYRLLPIVVISSDQQLETIQQVYELGIQAFVYKSPDQDRWQAQLDELAHYWLTIVTLPKQLPL
ncbi:response regulator [Spirosoma koreense]